MNDKIIKELANFQNELSRLDSAVKHIEDAEKISKAVIEKSGELNEKYSQFFNEAKDIMSNFTKASSKAENLIYKLEEIDFDAKFNALNSEFDSVRNEFGTIKNQIEELKSSNIELLNDLEKQLSAQEKKIDSSFKETKTSITKFSNETSTSLKTIADLIHKNHENQTVA